MSLPASMGWNEIVGPRQDFGEKKITQIAPVLQGYIWVGESGQNDVPGHHWGMWLHTSLFHCRVTSDTNRHLLSEMPKGYCKAARPSMEIPPPGTQSKSKKMNKVHSEEFRNT